MNMLQTIVPKSTQLNADDLIGEKSRTIVITRVVVKSGEQPCEIYFEGGNVPYLPCKSMRRVLVQIWGPDANAYVGRSMTIYRDEKVQWAGQAVGGIRISHMSHLDGPRSMALTATKGKRAPHTVHPLQMESEAPPLDAKAMHNEAMKAAKTMDELDEVAQRVKVDKSLSPTDHTYLRHGYTFHQKRISQADQQQPAGELFDNGGTGMPPNH